MSERDYEAEAQRLLHKTIAPVPNWDEMTRHIARSLRAADRAGYARGLREAPTREACVVCGADLLETNVPPHCVDCIVEDGHREVWEALRDRSRRG